MGGLSLQPAILCFELWVGSRKLLGTLTSLSWVHAPGLGLTSPRCQALSWPDLIPCNMAAGVLLSLSLLEQLGAGVWSVPVTSMWQALCMPHLQLWWLLLGCYCPLVYFFKLRLLTNLYSCIAHLRKISKYLPFSLVTLRHLIPLNTFPYVGKNKISCFFL